MGNLRVKDRAGQRYTPLVEKRGAGFFHFPLPPPYFRIAKETPMRVADHLNKNHIPFETVVHPPAFSAQKRAHCLHVPGKQVAKGVLLVGTKGYYLAVLPATHQVDLLALSNGLNQLLRMADSEDITEIFSDCEFGVVPPFGSLYGVKTILDASLQPETTLVFEGHTHFETFKLKCKDYVDLEKPIRMPFARPAK